MKNTAMATKEERAEIKKKVTKVDPDDLDTNVHRLVQDENAKTILLNFPLEVSTSENNGGKLPKKPSPRPGDDKKGAKLDLGDKFKRPKLGASSARIRSASVGRDKKSDLQVLSLETSIMIFWSLKQNLHFSGAILGIFIRKS